MAESELENAFATLAEAFTLTESELNEEINDIMQQIEKLSERINDLNSRQHTLTQDRSSIEEMYKRYSSVG